MIAGAQEQLTAAGHEVVVIDLYAKRFNPTAGRHDFKSIANPDHFHYQTEQAYAAEHNSYSDDIATKQALILTADVFVPVFPLWWGAAPAIMNGWFERVLSYGFGYVDGARFDKGLFRRRRA